jgi:transposase
MAAASVERASPKGDPILAILGAMNVAGMIATMIIEDATDQEIFLAHLGHVLYPKLKPGDVVVMANLSLHKVAGVRERIEAAGAVVLYLPPYSPDLKPLEKGLVQAQTVVARGQGTIRRSSPTSHC